MIGLELGNFEKRQGDLMKNISKKQVEQITEVVNYNFGTLSTHLNDSVDRIFTELSEFICLEAKQPSEINQIREIIIQELQRYGEKSAGWSIAHYASQIEAYKENELGRKKHKSR